MLFSSGSVIHDIISCVMCVTFVLCCRKFDRTKSNAVQFDDFIQCCLVLHVSIPSDMWPGWHDMTLSHITGHHWHVPHWGHGCGWCHYNFIWKVSHNAPQLKSALEDPSPIKSQLQKNKCNYFRSLRLFQFILCTMRNNSLNKYLQHSFLPDTSAFEEPCFLQFSLSVRCR